MDGLIAPALQCAECRRHLADTTFHIYIDADVDADTGREGMGVEYMLSVVGGRATSNYFAPTGERSAGPVGREVSKIAGASPLGPMSVEQDGEVIIDTEALQLRVDAHGQLVGPDGPHVTELVDGEGTVFSSALADAELTIEENGPVRTVIKSVEVPEAGDLPRDLPLRHQQPQHAP